jgi:hypothetical protein
MLKLKKLNTRQGINDYYPYSMYKAYAYFPEQKWLPKPPPLTKPTTTKRYSL